MYVIVAVSGIELNYILNWIYRGTTYKYNHSMKITLVFIKQSRMFYLHNIQAMMTMGNKH